jgi:SAM-dependent methyltransferase
MKNPGNIWYELDVRYSNRNIDPILQANYKHKRVIYYFNKILNRQNISNFKIFDVGCGVGNFLAYAKNFGYDCTGIDFDRDGIEVGKRVFGLGKLYVDDLYSFKIKYPNEKFDLVSFFDVFEHLEDHNLFTDAVKKYLNESGYIALSTPYRGAATWLMPNDLPPRHLTRWNISSQVNFFEKRGFKVVDAVKLSASIPFIALKLKWKYGSFFAFNLVNRVKASEVKDTYINSHGNKAVIVKDSLKLKLVKKAAYIKDMLIFGLPATLIFLSMLGSEKRYVDLCLIAKKVV